jgi:hypothetical protein
MRNTTKLKQILLKYNLDLSMEEEGLLTMTLIDKITGKMQAFEHTSYSQLVGKVYSHFLKTLKTDLDLENPGRNRKPA